MKNQEKSKDQILLEMKTLMQMYEERLSLFKSTPDSTKGDFYQVTTNGRENSYYVRRLKSKFGNRNTVSFQNQKKFETKIEAINFMRLLENEINDLL